MGQKDWVKAIGKKLREDLGDCPTVPQELLDILKQLNGAKDNDLEIQIARPKPLPGRRAGR